MVTFPICIFNSSYTTFFPFIWSISVSVYDAFVFRRARQLTNISAEQERFACQCDRQCRLCACIQHWCMPNFYSMINARFNERRTDANRGDILSSHDKNQIHVHNHAGVHTVSYVSVIIEPFWSLCVINMPKRLFFLNHWIRAWWNHIGWCLSQMLSAKAQGSLCFCAISSGNSKFWSGWRI